MFVIRDIFRLKFGQSKEATALWKQVIEIGKKNGFAPGGTRLLTDVAGAPYYTIVFESMWDSLQQWDDAHAKIHKDQHWRDVYMKITALTEEGHREIYSVID